MPISSGTGILPVQMSRHDKSHGQDARATGVAPIDPSGPANLSWRQTTSALSCYVFIETALTTGISFRLGGASVLCEPCDAPIDRCCTGGPGVGTEGIVYETAQRGGQLPYSLVVMSCSERSGQLCRGQQIDKPVR